MEYAKDAETIKGNDLKQSLNLEKNKSFDLMNKLTMSQAEYEKQKIPLRVFLPKV